MTERSEPSGVTEVASDVLLAKAEQVLRWIEVRGNHSGVIPCPQDYEYYVRPMQSKAGDMASEIRDHLANASDERLDFRKGE